MTDREIVALFVKTRAELKSVQDRLDTLIDQAKSWHAQPDLRPDAEQTRQHQDALLMVYGRFRVLQGEYESLLGLVKRLLDQHQSAKAAFVSGWDARLVDLQAKATTEEFAQLRRLLNQIGRLDRADDDLPF